MHLYQSHKSTHPQESTKKTENRTLLLLLLTHVIFQGEHRHAKARATTRDGIWPK